MRFDRLTEPVSVTKAVIVGILVGAIVYIFDPAAWVTAGAAGLLVILVSIGERLIRPSREDPHS